MSILARELIRRVVVRWFTSDRAHGSILGASPHSRSMA